MEAHDEDCPPPCTPITNSTNWLDSLSTGVGRARILLQAFPNASGSKPLLSPGCCSTAGWRST